MDRTRTLVEVWGFMATRKKYWLGPVIVMLVMLGLLVVLGESSALGPFVYPFF